MPVNAFTNEMEATYEEKMACVDGDTMFEFFRIIGAKPVWGQCGGKDAINLLTLCHGGTHHKAYYDPESQKVTCFSECNHTYKVHNWVSRALGTENPNAGKECIADWMDKEEIDFDYEFGTAFLWNCTGESDYQKTVFDPSQTVEMVRGIPPKIISELYSNFDTSRETLARLCWHHEDGIPVEQLAAFQVAYYPEHGTIILPHHNANGEIVGLYERYFGPLRSECKEYYAKLGMYEDGCVNGALWSEFCRIPTAKYKPLRKEWKYRYGEGDYCWSFPNGRNLYGLHRAKDAIAQTGKAIIFEGAKSVMLAHAYGYPFAVASHTFGASLNHIAMLAQAGAKEIILAFDRQYHAAIGEEWDRYEQRTKGLADRVIGSGLTVSRIVDVGDLLRYKDAPIDMGKEIFEDFYKIREVLTM